MVQKAFEVGGVELVQLIECENGNWNPFAIWDNGHAHWLCQINDIYHSIPQEYFDDWWFQIEYCAEKMKWWTKFYWPSRTNASTKFMKCKDYVMDRFTFVG